MSYSPHSTARAGVVLPPSPTVRLVARKRPAQHRSWDIPLPERGTWKITGGAGTGVSSFVVDTVIARLQTGAHPDSILVVATSKESGALLRRELSTHLENFAASSSPVRSVHSLAFALLRKDSEEDLRLITGAEQDAVIRELLEGHAADGGAQWPEEYRPALSFVGFARQLRDFLLRAIERGLSPDDLEELGDHYHQPMWRSAGIFLREYEHVQELRGVHSLSAAELISQVLLRPHLSDNHQWDTIVVDDAQLLDPTAGRLITEMSKTTELTVVAGDPDQAVFAFRGANEEFLQNFPAEHTLELTESQRHPEPACVSIVESEGTLRDVIADTVRRRHLSDGVPWQDIAVIVRGSGDIGKVRRTLLSAGVPVHINPTDVVLSEQRLVAAMLLALRGLEEELTNSQLEDLLTGPVGGADPVTLRRLIRGLRRYAPDKRGIDTLRELLDGELPDFKGLLTEREETILTRIRDIIGAGRKEIAAENSVEEILWAVWQETGLDARLQAAALRGGATGSQADRDLDAMMSLFDAAGDFVERYDSGATLSAFIKHIEEQELPTGVRDRRTATPQAVEVITAHGAVGREWDTVVVVGAQEGQWPALGETGSLFDQEKLVDLIDHRIEPNEPVSHLASRLAEERRLFHVATSRHRQRLVIAAIDQPDGDVVAEPSRFIEEFCGKGVDVPGAQARREANQQLRRSRLPRELGLDVPEPAPVRPETEEEVDPLQVSVLSVPSFVAQLRRVVTDPESGETERTQAVRQLARMAEAGVPGAHPDEWWAARELASEHELEAPARLSPSKVEALLTCPLNAMLSNLTEEDDGSEIHLQRGNITHAFLEALGRGADPDAAFELTMEAYGEVLNCPDWQRETKLEEFADLLERTRSWALKNAEDLVGVEVPVSVDVDGIRIGGYIDRLSNDGTDYYVIDLKTGKSAPTKADVQDNAQLATYQLALEHGQLIDGAIRTGDGMSRGGGVLYYPAVGVRGTSREQARLDDEQLNEFAEQLPPLLEEMRGPKVTARENDGCDDCPIRSICPVHTEGRMTTDV